MNTREWLMQSQVIVCVGSGGVGKTTMSAALGVLAAQMGRKTLVLTIDPARRLAQSLGLENIDVETKVPGQNFKGELWSSMIDSQGVFREFLLRFASPETVARLEKNNLYQQLASKMSGSQEFTSIIKLYECAVSGRYDLVILDTPPAAHAIDFLTAPDRISGLFQNQITQWFADKPESATFFSKIFFRGTQAALQLFQRVTGAQFIKELQDFFQSIRSIQSKIAEKSLASKTLLLSEKTSFVLVTGFDRAKLEEGRDFFDQLTSLGYHLREIIVNRAVPMWFDDLSEQDKNALLHSKNSAYSRFFAMYCNYLVAKNKIYDELQKTRRQKVPVVRIPEFASAPLGLTGLIELAGETERGGLKWSD